MQTIIVLAEIICQLTNANLAEFSTPLALAASGSNLGLVRLFDSAGRLRNCRHSSCLDSFLIIDVRLSLRVSGHDFWAKLIACTPQLSVIRTHYFPPAFPVFWTNAFPIPSPMLRSQFVTPRLPILFTQAGPPGRPGLRVDISWRNVVEITRVSGRLRAIRRAQHQQSTQQVLTYRLAFHRGPLLFGQFHLDRSSISVHPSFE